MNERSNEVRHLLIFEPDARGHAAEWIEHLMRKVDRDGIPEKVSLVIPPDLAGELAGDRSERWQSRLNVLPLNRLEVFLCNCRLLSLNGIVRWWIMRRKLGEADADHGLFLSLDLLTLPLALGLGFRSRQVSGILFRPSVHYRADADARPRFTERLRELRKSILYKLTLRNPALRSVPSLDPHFPAYAATRYRGAEKIYALPDPVHPFPAEASRDLIVIDDAPARRVVFVIFGVLSERKGVLVLLEALRRLEPRYASAIAVYAAGQIDRSIMKQFQEMCAELQDVRPEIWLRIENRRLTTGEIAALIARTDVVLAPYQRFVGSSGVLLWAAKARKPVITQEYGLLGRLAREHALGMAVDTSDPSALAGAIAAAVRDGADAIGDRDSMTRFAQTRTPDAFATGVLEGVQGPRSPASNQPDSATKRSRDPQQRM